MVKHIKNKDKQLLESLIEKYGSKGVEAAINRLNEWNMWDKPKSDDFYSAAIRQAERNRPRLIDVVDELPKRNHDAQRYKDDPEYHEHIKRLEAQLRKTTDPQEAEYLERRINKLKSLSESKAINKLNKNRIYESIYYDYDRDLFNPKACLTWLIQNRLLNRFNSSYDIDEWAEMAQYAAEDAGVPLDDAERVYDVAYMKYAK